MAESGPGDLRFSVLTPDPILFDESQTGEFAPELAAIAQEAQVEPWCAYIAWRGQTPVGMGGFKSSPDANGEIEIGYLTFAASEGRGYATALAGHLVAIARDHGLRAVSANTLPENNASTRVLERNGFVRDGKAIDQDIGTAWRWVKRLR